MYHIKVFTAKHWKVLLKVTAASIFLTLIINGAGTQLLDINYTELNFIIGSLTVGQICILTALGVAACTSMMLYDYILMKFFHLSLTALQFLHISYVSNSINILLGMGGIPGAAARTILLRRSNLNLKDSVYYNALLMPATPTGLSLLAVWLITSQLAVFQALTSAYPWLYLGITVIILILPFFFFYDRIFYQFRNQNTKSTFILKLQLIAASFFEWISAFVFFYYIIRLYTPDINFHWALAVYAVAAIAGIMSFLPGGIGSFDMVAFVGLQHCGIDSTGAAAVVLLFRIFFFIIPGIAGSSILSISLMTSAPVEHKFPLIVWLRKIHLSTKQLIHSHEISINLISAILVFISGLILLASAIKPAIPARLDLIMELMPASVLHAAQLLSIVIGFLLCVLSFEVLYHVRRSYSMTRILLIFGGLFTFIKGLDFEEFLFLMLVLILLHLCKPQFLRYSIPLRLSKLLIVCAFSFVGIWLYFVSSNKIYVSFISQGLFPAGLASIYDDIVYNSVITYFLFSCFLFVMYIKKKRLEDDPRFEVPDFERLTGFLKEYQGDTLVHLLFLGDKFFFWSSDQKALIPFAKRKNLITVLGNPIGCPDSFSSVILEFQTFLDLYGHEAVFYEIPETHMTIYHENGYFFFKLGEEAVIDLNQFSLAGASKSNLRHTVNSFQKKGYIVQVLNPPFSDEVLKECRVISDEWLGNRGEMGFSMGWYDESYLQLSPLAILQDPKGRILAFVSLMPCYDGNKSMSTDLMRLRKDLPHGCMDYVFISLILYLKENGFQHFNLGMAPLSNVGQLPYSHLMEKVAGCAFHYGNFYYSFDGLRKFKEKYSPVWKPRYLAYRRMTALPSTMLALSRLISSRRKKP